MTMTKPLIWLVMDGGLAWCAWAAVHGVTGAGNVVMFMAGFCAITSVLVLVMGTKMAKESVPGVISDSYDAVLVLFLIWHGWFLAGTLFAISSIIYASLRSIKHT